MAKPKRKYPFPVSRCVACRRLTNTACVTCGAPLHWLTCSADYSNCDECIERANRAEEVEAQLVEAELLEEEQ